jgi:nicotinamidase-related amidase
VDLLRGFCEPGYPLYCGEPVHPVVSFVRQRAEAYRTVGDPILFSADAHAEDDPESQLYPPHCLAGTKEAEIIPELQEFVTADNVVPKTTLSCFYGTKLQERLNELKPERVELVGVCTNICILFCAYGLRIRTIPVLVPRAGVTSFDLAGHEWALKQLVEVLKCDVV